MALPGATRAVLGGLAPGWAPARDGGSFDDPLVCIDRHPVVRLEIDKFLDDTRDDVTELLTRAMDRVVNLFGTCLPLYSHRENSNRGVPPDY